MHVLRAGGHARYRRLVARFRVACRTLPSSFQRSCCISESLHLRTTQIRPHILGEKIEQIDLIFRRSPEVNDSKSAAFASAGGGPADFANACPAFDQSPGIGMISQLLLKCRIVAIT